MFGKMRILIICLFIIAVIVPIDGSRGRRRGHKKRGVKVQDEADDCYYESSIPQYRCHNFTGPYLIYHPSLANTKEIFIQGNFIKLIIDSQFRNVEELTINPTSFVPIFDISIYKDLPSLKSLTILRSNIGRIFTEGVENMWNFTAISIRNSAIESIEAPGFNSFPALQQLGFYHSNVSGGFDYNFIPTSLISLGLDSIETNENPCEALKSLSVLQSLTIHKFNGSEIDFDCMAPTLTDLTINHCRNARFLSLGAIGRFSSLKNLDLSYNNLETFNISILPSSIRSLAIHSTYKMSSVTCSMMDHLTKLKYIRLYRNKLTEFTCIPDSAEIVYLENNQISKIECADLERLNSTRIDLASNRLEEFDFSCIKYKRMEEIDLRYNRITTLDIKPLLGLHRLEVKLDGNIINCTCSLLADYFEIRQLEGNHFRWQCDTFGKCITCDQNSQLEGYPTFSSLSQVKTFDYKHLGCLLTHTSVSKMDGYDLENGCIYDNVYNTVPKVECQNYSSSVLSDLRAHHSNFANLESLDVQGNFSSLAIENEYENLTFIKLESDNLMIFNFSAVDKFPKLEMLDLSDNKIETIHTTDKMATLRILNLNNNDITNPNSTNATTFNFENFDNLNELLLSHNSLNYFDMNILPVYSMFRLDLSHNNISAVSFPEGAKSNWWDKYDLRVFDLSYNQLSTFSLKYPNSTSKYIVEELRLSYNRFNSFDINDLPKEMKKLDLSHNNISNVVFYKGTNYITTIDLSWNALTHFNLDDVWLGNLKELLLNNNNILTIRAWNRADYGSPNLNIQNNLIKCDCDFLTSYSNVLNETLTCNDGEDCFTCREDSHLANYPWFNPTQQLLLLQKTKKECQELTYRGPENGQIVVRASVVSVFISFAFMFLTQ